jgi:ABC-type multidrug transport system fused ATPase/permease subunit
MLFLKDIAHYIGIYSKHGRWRLVLLVMITLLAGLVEMLGITMLLPILNLSFDTQSNDPLSQLLQQVFTFLGLPLTLNVILMTLVVIFLVKGLSVFFQKYYTAVISLTLRKNLQNDVAETVKHVNYATFSTLNPGYITNLIIKETAGFSASFSEFSRMMSGMVYIGFYLIAFTALKPEIIVILIAATAGAYFILKRLVLQTKKISIETTAEYGKISNKTIEVLQNYVYLKSVSKLKAYMQDVTNYIASIQIKKRKLMFYAAIVNAIKEPVAVIALVGLIYYQVSINGEPLTEIIIIGLLLYRILNQVLLLQGQWQRFNTCIGSLKAIEDTLELFRANTDVSTSAKTMLDTIPMPIAFKDVSFSHGDTPVLNAISFDIQARKTIGLVGPSGSGKTTLFHLITGLIAPNHGAITFGKYPYTDLDKNSIRSNIGYVAQDPAIFEGTLYENLVLSEADISDEQIKKALKEASCSEFLDMLDKQVGDNGKNLSGGQKQRLSIARELLKDPEMLIFDEATSALDSVSDEEIRNTLKSIHGTRTIVIISHRLSSVEICDTIHVMKDGHIVESGDFKTLKSDKSSFFAELYSKQ